MNHSFKIVFDGYPFDITSLSIILAVDLGIHLNRTVIGVDSTNRQVQSLSVNPFLDEYYGLQFTCSVKDHDPYFNKIYRDDYVFLESDFVYKQHILFSYKDGLDLKQSNKFLIALYKILTRLEMENKSDSIFLYTWPDKSEIIYKKINGSVSVNQSCDYLFNGNLIEMSNLYI